MQIIPEPDSLWTHRNGTVYRVLMLTNVGSTKEDYPPTVVYQNIDNNTWWSRPLNKWVLNSFMPVYS